MKKKIIGVFVCTLLIAAAGISVAGTFKQSMEITSDASYIEQGSTELGWYTPAGTWLRDDKIVIVSINPSGLGRYTLSTDWAGNASYGGVFPTAVWKTQEWGEAVWKSKNTYDFSMLGDAVDEDHQFVYFVVWSGTMKVTSHDTYEARFTAAFYGPDQDPFGEDPPLICLGPYEHTYNRIPVVPPCGS